MEKNSIVINRTGVYLFHSPTTMSLQINRELLVMLAIPERKIVGLCLLEPSVRTSDIFPLLDSLIFKLRVEMKIAVGQIQTKLFGLSTPHTAIKNTVDKFISERKLTLVSEDMGRNIARKILIDCSQGLAGVSYAEYTPPGDWERPESSINFQLTPAAVIPFPKKAG